MKITVDIDCTPEEARTFFGMPDVTGLNTLIMNEVERKAKANLDSLTDPEAFVGQMMQAGGAMQSMMMQMMGAAATKKD